MQALAQGLKTVFLLLLAIITVAIVVFLYKSFFEVGQENVGLVLRFGKLRGDTPEQQVLQKSGTYLTFPYPIDQKILIPARRVQRVMVESLWHPPQNPGQRLANTLKPGVDGYSLTGDHNIIHSQWQVSYEINPVEAVKYFQAVAGGFSGSDGLAQIAQGNPLEPMMEKLLLRAVTHAVSEMTIDEAWPKTDLLEREVSGKLRDSVKTLDLGIDIASLEVRVMQLTPALQTRQAFLAVSKALDERQGIVQQAEGYRNKTLNDADAEALRIVSEAQGAADELKAAVDADATRFAELYPQYLENPILLRKKLYEDALDRVFQQVDEFFLVDDQNGRELRLMLDRQKKKKDQDKDTENGS